MLGRLWDFAWDNWTFNRTYLESECVFRCHFLQYFYLYDEVATISDIVIILIDFMSTKRFYSGYNSQ
jgi:hypothetical protein